MWQTKERILISQPDEKQRNRLRPVCVSGFWRSFITWSRFQTHQGCFSVFNFLIYFQIKNLWIFTSLETFFLRYRFLSISSLITFLYSPYSPPLRKNKQLKVSCDEGFSLRMIPEFPLRPGISLPYNKNDQKAIWRACHVQSNQFSYILQGWCNSNNYGITIYWHEIIF